MIGILIAIILVVLLGGVILHLLWAAIVIAAAVGLVMFLQNKLGGPSNRGRIR